MTYSYHDIWEKGFRKISERIVVYHIYGHAHHKSLVAKTHLVAGQNT